MFLKPAAQRQRQADEKREETIAKLKTVTSIVIEGNVGSGKSAVIARLKAYRRLDYVEKRVRDWAHQVPSAVPNSWGPASIGQPPVRGLQASEPSSLPCLAAASQHDDRSHAPTKNLSTPRKHWPASNKEASLTQKCT